MTLYFFKDRSKERVDFVQLIDEYFDKLDHTTINSNDDEVSIVIDMPNFGCSYHYLITKRSRVTSFYRLNSNYVNTFLLCEIPEVVPQFVFRQILKQVEELCSKFEFALYHDEIDNIREFNMFEMIAFLTKKRAKHLSENHDVVRYPIEQDLLNEICTYQSLLGEINGIVKDDIVVGPYIILKDSTDHIYFSVNWSVGLPATFPPHLDFVQIEEEENLVNLVPIQVFYKYVEKYMYEIKDGSIDIQIKYLNESGSIKARKLIKKMRKYIISTYKYEPIKIIDLIEK